MSKKYLIIMIAACVLCLGGGIIIGMGLNQNNLSATGAAGNPAVLLQAAAEDFAAMDPQELKKALKDYTEKLGVMEERQELAKEALAEMRENADKIYAPMTDGLYRSLNIIYKARKESEKLSLALCALDKIRTYKPGSMVDGDIWDDTAEQFLKVIELFDEAVAFYETTVDDIWKKLSDIEA